MADVLTTQILEDGDRNAVVKIVGTQVDGDLTYTTVIDPADFTPDLGQFRIDVVQYSVEPGLTVSLWWDAPTPGVIATLAGSGKFDATRYGGWWDDVLGPTGLIGLSTEGWAALSQYGFTLVLQLVKQNSTETPGQGLLLWQQPTDILEWESGGYFLLS